MDYDGPESGSVQENFPSPEPPRPAQKSRRTAFVVTTLGVLALGLLGLLVVKANSDKAEMQDRLDASKTEVAELTSQLEAGTQRADGLEARLSDIEAELDTANEQVKVAGEVRDGVIDFLALSMTVGAGLSDPDGRCIAEALADEMGVAELLSATLAAADLGLGATAPSSETLRFGLAVVSAAEDCGISLDDPTLGQAASYGDDPVLDALYDQCASGQMGACDQLYIDSPLGSGYESFAGTCGGRFDIDSAPAICESALSASPVISGSPLPQIAASGADPAIDLQAPTIAGFDFDSNEVEIGTTGRPTAVVFLAHWCPHCQDEVPRVQAWLDSGGGVDGVDIVGVVSSTNASRPNYPPSDWLQREGWTPTVLVDSNDGAVMAAFGLGAFPSWVFLNADGTVAARSLGELDIAGLETFMEMIAP